MASLPIPYPSTSLALPRVPRLPSELLEAIFIDESLSRTDLARLCLVSRQFLACARGHLYSRIVVVLEDYVLDDPRTRHLSHATARLLEVLRSAPALARQVKAIEVVGVAKRLPDLHKELALPWPGSKEIGAFLALSPNLALLTSNDTFELLKVLDRGVVLPKMVRFEYGWNPNLVEASVAQLRKLKCGSFVSLDSPLGHGGSSRLSLPLLEVLEATAGLSIILPSYVPSLRTLRIRITDSAIQHLEVHRSLRYLYLLQPVHSTSGRDGEPFSTLTFPPSLHSLSIEIRNVDAWVTAGLEHLFRRLPPHLNRLEFPGRIPSDALSLLIPSSLSIANIGVSSPLPHELKKQTVVDRLRALTDEHGIKLYFTPEKMLDFTKL